MQHTAQQQQNKRKYQQQIIEFLKLFIKNTNKQDHLKTLTYVLNEFVKDSNTATLSQRLDDLKIYKIALRLLNFQFNAWKKGYTDAIKKYPPKLDFSIDNFLLQIQKNIKFDVDECDKQYTKTKKYLTIDKSYNIQIIKARKEYNWEKQFLNQWKEKKQIYQKQEQQKNAKRKQAQLKSKAKKEQEKAKQEKDKIISKQKQQTTNKKQPITATTKIQAKQITKIETINKQQQQKRQKQIDTKQSIQKIASQRPKKKKSISSSEQSDQQSKSESNNNNANKNKRQQQRQQIKMEQPIQRKHQYPSQTNQHKNTTQILINYLQTRKDLAITSANIKHIAQYLNAHLNKFMKNIINNTINIAKLRNENYNKNNAGDQFKYYSKHNTTLKCQNTIAIPINAKIYEVKYSNKLELFSQIKVKEQEKQQNFRQELMRKRDTDKRKQNKILDYLLRKRQNHSQIWHVSQQPKINTLTISNNHLQFILENHPWFNDGIAMLKSLY